jgi:hypothetical protein
LPVCILLLMHPGGLVPGTCSSSAAAACLIDGCCWCCWQWAVARPSMEASVSCPAGLLALQQPHQQQR